MNWLKENWFKMAVITCAVIFLAVYSYSVYQQKRLSPKEELKLKLEDKLFRK